MSTDCTVLLGSSSSRQTITGNLSLSCSPDHIEFQPEKLLKSLFPDLFRQISAIRASNFIVVSIDGIASTSFTPSWLALLSTIWKL